MSMCKPWNIAPFLLVLFLGLSCACALARGGHASHGHARPLILWVQEVHEQPQYWVNDKPCGRAPLSALATASGSERIAALTVILDSRVPIHEMAEVEGLMEKMDIKNVHYYVFDHAYPNIGMSQIIWKSQSRPLPAPPPKAENDAPLGPVQH